MNIDSQQMESDDDLLMLTAAAAAAVVILRKLKRRRRTPRRMWSREWLLERNTTRGMAHFVNYELSVDASGFQGFLRMSVDVFKELMEMIEPSIRRSDTQLRESISPEEMLIVTLRYFATGKYKV
jgi:hypothetical protein